MLVLSNNKKIAEKIMHTLDDWQQWGIGFNRNLQNNMLMPDSLANNHLMKYNIETFSFSDITQICAFHHFDMFIAYDLNEDKKGQVEGIPPDIYLNGYEYLSSDWPSRTMVERYMNDMLNKNN